jgi:hypothetical protein
MHTWGVVTPLIGWKVTVVCSVPAVASAGPFQIARAASKVTGQVAPVWAASPDQRHAGPLGEHSRPTAICARRWLVLAILLTVTLADHLEVVVAEAVVPATS